MTTQTGHRAAPCVLGTYGYHAILTHKQADVLTYLYCDGDVHAIPCREIADCLHDLQTDDMCAGYPIHYAPPSYASIYATLRTLEGRGLVKSVDRILHGWKDGVDWEVTPSGADAARRYCT